jgi:hypothetical protein
MTRPIGVTDGQLATIMRACKPLEQQVTDTVGLFARAGWVDGNVEPWDFTDIDPTVSVGVALFGKSLLADRGYDADWIRALAGREGLLDQHPTKMQSLFAGFFLTLSHTPITCLEVAAGSGAYDDQASLRGRKFVAEKF